MAWGSPPQNVRWERTGDRNMVLKWNAVAGARSYGIQVQYGGVDGRTELRWRNIRATQFKISNWGSNLGYRLRVWASAGDGWTQSQNSSYSAWTPWFYTPPVAPRNVKATPTPDGVLVSWTRAGSYYRQGTEVEADPGLISEGGSVLLGNGTSGAAPTQYLAEGDGGTGLRYRARGFVGAASPAGRRVFGPWSAWTAPVARAVPPSPPQLHAVGAVPAGGAALFSWAPAPRDGSQQTGAEVRYRPLGGPWTSRAVAGASTDLSETISAPGAYEWQARTKALSGEFGDWSAVATFEVVTRPVVTIIAPASPLNAGKATLQWTYAQAEDLPQTHYTAQLKQGAGVLEEKSLVGATTRVTFSTRLEDATSYEVTLKVAAGGVDSSTATRNFTTQFARPATPVLEGFWDGSQGAHVLTVGSGGSGAAATVRVLLERSLDGYTWVEVQDEILAASEVIDFEGRTRGVTHYRATAFSSLEAPTSKTVEIVSDSGNVWLHPEGNGPLGISVQYNPEVGVSFDKPHSELVFFDGDTTPTLVEEIPTAVSKKVQVAGVLVPLWDSEDGAVSADTLRQVEATFKYAARTVLRWQDGSVLYGSVRSLSTTPVTTDMLPTVSFDFEEAR